MKTIHVRLTPELVQHVKRQVNQGKKKFAELDQQFDVSKYVRLLIRQDIKKCKDYGTKQSPVCDEEYNDILKMVYLPDRG